MFNFFKKRYPQITIKLSKDHQNHLRFVVSSKGVDVQKVPDILRKIAKKINAQRV